jgi:hypothetical protein
VSGERDLGALLSGGVPVDADDHPHPVLSAAPDAGRPPPPLALLFIALATNAVVVARTWTSSRLAQPSQPFANASPIVFDFDGTRSPTRCPS